MDQPWTSIASLTVSLIALCIAGMSLRISWQKDRRELEATQPTAYATVKPVPDHPNWYEVMVKIENRSAFGYRCEGVDILGPFGARGMHKGQATIPVPNKPPALLDTIPFEKTTTNILMRAEIAKAGVEAPKFSNIRMGAGHDHSATLLIFARSSMWSRTLSMRVKLVSMQPIERRIEIPIKRTLPHENKTAKA